MSNPTLEDLDAIIQKIKVRTEKLMLLLYPNGKPDYMTPEKWAEINGGKNDA